MARAVSRYDHDVEDRDRYDDDQDWRSERSLRGERRRSPGLVGRLFRAVRFLVFILPLSLLLLGSFVVDCRDRSGTGALSGVVRSSACAREDVTRRLADLEGTMRTISAVFR